MDKRTLRRTQLNIDNVINLYLSGKTFQFIADDSGCSVHAIQNCLRRHGVYRSGDWKGTIKRKYGITVKELLSMYKSGMWKNEIAAKTGISEGMIGKYLSKLGIPLADSRSKAMSDRLNRMSHEERQDLTKAANDAVRGMKRTFADLRKRALGNERIGKTRGKAESDLFQFFLNKGISVISQKAVGKYNLDFSIGNIAVEVTGRSRKLESRSTYTERIKYILNSGFALIYVWANSQRPMESGAADYIIAFTQEFSRNPSLIGQYRVIRCDGKLLASGSVNDNNLTGILTPVSGTFSKT